MERAVRDFRKSGLSILPSHSGMICINLREIVHLYPVHKSVSDSFIDLSVLTNFCGVTCNKMASPGLNILTLNLDISGKHNDFTSHINSTKFVSG
jgi:hypothetical protein